MRPEYYGNPAGLTEDVGVVRAVYDAFAARDLDRALPFVAEDCEIVAEATARLAGRTGPYRGHQGVRDYFADVEAEWHELSLEAYDFRVLPGAVIVMGHVAGVRAGVRIHRNAMWTWRLRDGRAASVRVADLGDAPPAGGDAPSVPAEERAR
ncbi:MAG TPA: nuclear transport factor 2 family protein [Solirubrobacteraceae bacterium]|nr:nuclear transport factor 2 family protein [Solirubrobacteraceae bacterium]